MDRRTLLASASGALLPSLAGCLGGAVQPPGANTSGVIDQDGVRTGRASPPPASSYPEYGDDVDRTVGYDTIDPREEAIYLEPSAREIEPGEPITFELENGRAERLATNFFAWRIHAWADGEWIPVAPRGWPVPLTYLDPGDDHAWTIAVENAAVEAGEPVPHVGGTDGATVHGLGGGHYAFGTTGRFDVREGKEPIAFSARFELDADPLVLTPTNAIQTTEWDGDTLVATSDRGDPVDHRLGAYELERVGTPSAEPRRPLTEHVVRNDQLRDTLALAIEHDAPRVRLEEYNGTYPIFGTPEAPSFEFRGTYYDVTKTVLEE